MECGAPSCARRTVKTSTEGKDKDMRQTWITLVGLTALLISAPAPAKDKSLYTHAEMVSIVENARSTMKSTGVNSEDGYISTVSSVEDLGSDQWKVMVVGAWREGKMIRTLTYPGLIRFFGSRLEFLFLTQPVPLLWAQDIFNYENIQKACARWQEQAMEKGMQLQAGVEDDRLYLKYTYDFGDGVGAGDIIDRLKNTWRASSDLITACKDAAEEVNKQRLKELEGKISHLDRRDIPIITNDDAWDEYEVEIPGVAEGAWDFSFKDRPMDLYNYGDSVVVQTNLGLGQLTPDARTTVQAELTDWLEHNPLNHAATRTFWGGDGSTLTVASRFAFDGNLKGKDFAESYREFLENYSVKVWEKVGDLTGNIAKQIGEGGLTHISGPELLMVLEDDLSKLEQEHSEAKEGFWVFTYQELDFEVLNFGDRVVVTSNYSVPEEATDAGRAVFLGKVQKWVNGHQAKEATRTEAEWKPGVDNVFWIKATFELGNGMTGKKIHDGYWHFCDKYSHDLDKQVQKAADSL
jgi:hypothetical protein